MPQISRHVPWPDASTAGVVMFPKGLRSTTRGREAPPLCGEHNQWLAFCASVMIGMGERHLALAALHAGLVCGWDHVGLTLPRTDTRWLCGGTRAGTPSPGGRPAGGGTLPAGRRCGASGRSACSAATAAHSTRRLPMLRALPARAGRSKPTPGCRQAHPPDWAT